MFLEKIPERKTVMFHFKIGKKIVCRMIAKQEAEKTLEKVTKNNASDNRTEER